MGLYAVAATQLVLRLFHLIDRSNLDTFLQIATSKRVSEGLERISSSRTRPKIRSLKLVHSLCVLVNPRREKTVKRESAMRLGVYCAVNRDRGLWDWGTGGPASRQRIRLLARVFQNTFRNTNRLQIRSRLFCIGGRSAVAFHRFRSDCRLVDVCKSYGPTGTNCHHRQSNWRDRAAGTSE